MKKIRILSLVTVIVLVFAVLAGCTSKKEDFVADFNEKMSAKGLATLPEEMTVESEGKNKTIKSAELEEGITLRVEFVNRNNKAQSIKLIGDYTNDSWAVYATALMEMYVGQDYSVEKAVKQLGDFEFPGSVKINGDPRATVSLQFEGEDESVRVLEINRP